MQQLKLFGVRCVFLLGEVAGKGAATRSGFDGSTCNRPSAATSSVRWSQAGVTTIRAPIATKDAAKFWRIAWRKDIQDESRGAFYHGELLPRDHSAAPVWRPPVPWSFAVGTAGSADTAQPLDA
jgi:hypothetical protein